MSQLKKFFWVCQCTTTDSKFAIPKDGGRCPACGRACHPLDRTVDYGELEQSFAQDLLTPGRPVLRLIQGGKV